MQAQKLLVVAGILVATAIIPQNAHAQWQYYAARGAGPAFNYLYGQTRPYAPAVRQFNRQYVYPQARQFGGWAGGQFRYETTPMYPRGYRRFY